MSEETNGLDSFLQPENTETSATQTDSSQNTSSDGLSLEDEFTKLLNDFIAQDTGVQPNIVHANATPSPQQATGGLDGFVDTPQQATGGLDGFVDTPQQAIGGLDGFVDTPQQATGGLDDFVDTPQQATGGLDGFIDTPPQAIGGLDGFVDTPQQSFSGLDGFASDPSQSSSLDGMISEASENEETEGGLKSEEQELARAVSNFRDGVTAMASNKNLKMPTTDYEESMLSPNYKPSVGKKIAQYLLDCWDIINKYDPESMKKLSPEANDEEYLSFAETLSDTYMQFAIISYVEILINLEICEVNYEQKKEERMKNKIKRELYEEYMELQARKNMFIQKLKEKNFPIDVDKLINNYFRAAQKDADGAFEALTKNPAMFSRIEVEKLRPKFFGLIKVTPVDGIKANQKIGSYIKKLKV